MHFVHSVVPHNGAVKSIETRVNLYLYAFAFPNRDSVQGPQHPSPFPCTIPRVRYTIEYRPTPVMVHFARAALRRRAALGPSYRAASRNPRTAHRSWHRHLVHEYTSHPVVIDPSRSHRTCRRYSDATSQHFFNSTRRPPRRVNRTNRSLQLCNAKCACGDAIETNLQGWSGAHRAASDDESYSPRLGS